MERGLTFDVVDTPPPDRRDWPSLEDFQEREKTLKWRDLLLGIFRILDKFCHGRGRYGPSVVLKLEHENGEIFHVWAPSSVIYEMEKTKSSDFILNNGLKVSEDTGVAFYDFKLC